MSSCSQVIFESQVEIKSSSISSQLDLNKPVQNHLL